VRIIEENGHVRLSGVTDFDPEKTFACGQCFRWKKQPDGAYSGVAFGVAARVWLEGGDVCVSGTRGDFDAVWRDYFDLDRDYARVRECVSCDPCAAAACAYGCGIRILRQQPWEALCSFILSQCNNISRITGIVDTLCRLYGDPVGDGQFAFPAPRRVAALTERDLTPLRCGYRAPYVLAAARAISSGALDLEALREAPLDKARAALMALPGVGKKVAECALLYGLNRTEAFPVDVWIGRAIERLYGGKIDFARFGDGAGMAQQYLFHYLRNGGVA